MAPPRHCEERSDAAIQKAASKDWIASSQGLLAMTRRGSCLLRLPRHDPHLRRQRAVHRALVGDLQQFCALFRIQRAVDGYHPVDLVDHAVSGLAFRAILGVDLAML